jgi:N utilization substance protein B
MALRKRKSRELALQILFVWDANAARDEALAAQVARDAADADDSTRRQAMAMADAAWANRAVADEWVERLAPQWPPRRQPGVDRNVLRLAVWELTGAQTPPKVVIDEAIELAREFSTEQSPAFVNGVLDAVLREVRALVSDPRAKPPE